MSVDSVKRKKKKVEVDVVELTIELSAEFFDNMEKAKKQVADQRGYDVSYGEYLEEALEDLVNMVEDYSNKLVEASNIIQHQDKQLGQPEEVEPEIEDGKAPDELYGHIIKDEDRYTMYQ
jgi:hypothetical protein